MVYQKLQKALYVLAKGLLSIAIVTTVLEIGHTQSTEMRALQNTSRNIIQMILPSVVTIDTRSTVKVPGQRFGFFFSPFFFGDEENEENQPEREFQQEGLGTGIIVRKDKNTYYVVTNAHVVRGVDEVTIVAHDDEQYDVLIIGFDDARDLALVSFESKANYTPAALGDSDSLQQGDIVFAIGNPYGFRSTITFGIISALDREATDGSTFLTNYIQTDAAVNKGNSGGPLVNISGEVIGINTWIYSRGGEGNVGLSFAIPINNAKIAIDSVIERGSVDYGWLGVTIESISQFREELTSFDVDEGVLIRNVYMKSPAERAGVLPGDIVTSIDDIPIEMSSDMVKIIASKIPGEKVVLGLIRNGKFLTMNTTLSKRNTEESIANEVLWPGFKVFDITPDLKNRLDISSSNGVLLVNVEKNSPAGTAGLRDQDIIERVNNKKVRNVKEFYAELNKIKKNEEVIFRLVRDKTNLVVGLVY